MTLVAALLAFARGSSAQDFEEFGQLTAAASDAFALLTDDSDASARNDAVDLANEVVGWLIEFEASEAFLALPADQQESARTDRHRWEYNIARQWLVMGMCSEARDLIDETLQDGVTDAELLPRVSASFAEATTCASTSGFGTITIDVTPRDVQVIVDRVALGSADVAHRLELGEHDLTLRAEGYLDLVDEFELTDSDEGLNLGPYALTEVSSADPPPEPESSPSFVLSNTLLVSGAAVGGTGLALIVAGQRHQRLSDNPDEGLELADPAREERIVRNYRIAGVSCLLLAAASATTGLIVRPERDRRVNASVLAGPNFAALSVHVR